MTEGRSQQPQAPQLEKRRQQMRETGQGVDTKAQPEKQKKPRSKAEIGLLRQMFQDREVKRLPRAILERMVALREQQKITVNPAQKTDSGVQPMGEQKVIGGKKAESAESPVQATTETQAQAARAQENSAAEKLEQPKDTAILQANEVAYFAEFGQKFKPEERDQKVKELRDRYEDPLTNAEYVRVQVEEFAKDAGLNTGEVPELAGRQFDREAVGAIQTIAQEHIDKLFNSDQGIKNPEKHKLVSDETQRYLDLTAQAREAGDLPAEATAQGVLRLVQENIWKLAYQDRAARENWLGDHGVRHLVGHNIRVTEALLDELAGHGQQVKAIDRLIGHQVMIDHDMGYSMDAVRNQVNKGSFDADRGHNVLAAKFVREQGAADTALAKVFKPEHQAVLHEGILQHDASTINFRIGDASPQARAENLYSAIHVADSTHAFEDKLPEILYAHPDTLRSLRLMKTAGEIGDTELFQKLQAQLVEGIQKNPAFTTDDKDALTNAANAVGPNSYKFAVGRICGNKPEFSVNAAGGVAITVEESAIHQEVVGLYGQQSYDQLRKFVADLTGVDKAAVNLDQEAITTPNGKLEIRVRIGKNKAQENKTNYQQRLEEVIRDEKFQEFLRGKGDRLGDGKLANEQDFFQELYNSAAEGSADKQAFGQDLQRIIQQRRENLVQYLQGGSS